MTRRVWSIRFLLVLIIAMAGTSGECDPQPQIRKVFDIVTALRREAIFSSMQEADRYVDMLQKKEIEKSRGSS